MRKAWRPDINKYRTGKAVRNRAIAVACREDSQGQGRDRRAGQLSLCRKVIAWFFRAEIVEC